MEDEFGSNQEFWEEIARRRPDLPEVSRRCGFDIVRRRVPPPFRGTDVERAIKFAVAEVGAARASNRHDLKAKKVVPDLSAHSSRRRPWPPWVLPSIKNLRQTLFASEAPPFEAQAQKAAGWIKARYREQQDRYRPPGAEPAFRSATYQRLISETEERLARLTELSGFRHRRVEDRTYLSHFDPSQDVDRDGEDRIEIRRIKIHDQPPPGEEPSPLAVLATFTEIMGRLCGVRQEEAVGFVLCGVEPELQPVSLQSDPQAAVLPNGVAAIEPQVVVRVFHPPTDRVIRKVRGSIDALWEVTARECDPETEDSSPPLPDELSERLEEWVSDAPQKNGKVSSVPGQPTTSDNRLLRILEDLGKATDLQGQAPPDFSEVLREWERRGFPTKSGRGQVTKEALRRRYYRLRHKMPPTTKWWTEQTSRVFWGR